MSYNLSMEKGLRHDWTSIELLARASDEKRLREATPQEKFRVYASLYNAIWNARRHTIGASRKLDQWVWEKKLAQRLRMVKAFIRLDQLDRERAAGNDID
jgi:hypothetical protein